METRWNKIIQVENFSKRKKRIRLAAELFGRPEYNERSANRVIMLHASEY